MRSLKCREPEPARLFVARVRMKLFLNLRETAGLLGVEIDEVCGYEAGTIAPPIEVTNLLGVLDRHPYLLGEIWP